jgi:hypothetical protein
MHFELKQYIYVFMPDFDMPTKSDMWIKRR